MNTHEHMYHDDAKKAGWDLGQEAMKNLYDVGAQEYLAKTIAEAGGREKVFEEKKKCVCCMDEGTAHMDMEGKYALAGSGILFPAESWEQRLDKVADLLIGLKIEKVTSHDGCGAAKIACKRDGIETDKPDEYAIKWSKELQAKMNERLGADAKVEYEHIPANDMKRLPEYHNARAVWFDATGKFNPAVLGEKIPNGFVIDYANDTYGTMPESAEARYPFAELQVAINIAFGDHGFGGKFDADHPFEIVVIAESQTELDRVKILVMEFIKSMDIDDEKKAAIKVESFLANTADKLEQAA